MHPLAVLLHPLGDGGVVADRLQQLEVGRAAVAGVVDLQHGLADALLLVDLRVVDLEAISGAVELDRLVEVPADDADVVDASEG